MCVSVCLSACRVCLCVYVSVCLSGVCVCVDVCVLVCVCLISKDEKRMEKLQKRLSELEEVQQNVKVLSEMLDQHSKEAGSESDRQLMTELCQKCEEMKPRILRMASQITSTEEGMAEALKTNDDLLRVLDRYKAVFGALPTPQQQSGAGSEPGPQQVQDPLASTTTSAAGAAAMPPPTAASDGGGGGVDSLLIDLDLPKAGAGQSVPSSQSLLDDLGLLGECWETAPLVGGRAPITVRMYFPVTGDCTVCPGSCVSVLPLSEVACVVWYVVYPYNPLFPL